MVAAAEPRRFRAKNSEKTGAGSHTQLRASTDRLEREELI